MSFVNVFLCLRTNIVRVSLRLFVALSMAVISSAQQQPSIPLEFQNSGKIVSIRADSQEKSKDLYHLRGHVEVTYQEMKLTADEVTYDETTGEVVGTGHVLFTDPRSHIAADEVHYNIRTQKGWFSKAQGFIHTNPRARPRAPSPENPYIQVDRSKVLYTENPFYVQGEEIVRLDEDTYTLKNGRLTDCACEKDGWSFSARDAKMEVDNKVIARSCIIRFLGVPLFYLPVVGTSIARKARHTGFLLPYIGNSSIKGSIVGAGFFWAISPSMDVLVGLEDYSLRGLAEKGQFRLRPSDSTKLTVDYFGVNDKDNVRQNRAPGRSIKAVGDSEDFLDGFRGVADVDFVSSLAFRETYSPTFTEAVNSEARQIGFVTKDFSAYSFNIYASRYEDFLSAQLVPGNAVIIRETPQFSFMGMDKQAGESPFYFSFETSAGALGRTEPGLELPSLSERLDFHPEVTLRVKEFWGFHLTPSVGVDAARYGMSLGPNHDPLTRLLGDFSLDLRPPSLEKVFAWTLWGRRLKHVIEPDLVYRLVKARDSDELANLVRFDELDILSQTNEVEYSLTNTILARKDAPDGTADKPQAQDLLSLRISQKYYFDPTFGGVLGPGNPIVWEPTLSLTGFHFIPGRRLSPVVSDLKVAPFSFYDTELKIDLSPNGQGVLDAGITSHVKHGVYGLAFTDFYINKDTYINLLSGLLSSPSTRITTSATPTTSSYHLLNLLATYGDFNRKGLSGAFGVNYNLVQRIAAGGVAQVSYNFGCFGLNVEYQRFSLGTLRQENVFRVAISLANIGTFGDFKPRDRLY
jgi:LPS-assembly protein